MVEEQFDRRRSDCTLSDIAEIVFAKTTRSDHIFSVYGLTNKDFPGTVCVAHPVSRNSKIHLPEILSTKVENTASRKKPASPL